MARRASDGAPGVGGARRVLERERHVAVETRGLAPVELPASPLERRCGRDADRIETLGPPEPDELVGVGAFEHTARYPYSYLPAPMAQARHKTGVGEKTHRAQLGHVDHHGLGVDRDHR